MGIDRYLEETCVVVVNSKESEALQNLAFMCGYHWRYGEGKTVSHLDKEMLVFNTGGRIEFVELDDKICNVWALELAHAKYQRPCDLAKKLIKKLKN